MTGIKGEDRPTVPDNASGGRVPAAGQRRVRDDAHRWASVEIGRRVAALVERGLSVDQIVELANVLEVEPHTLMPDHVDNLRTEVAA